jgi:hypothetical protein
MKLAKHRDPKNFLVANFIEGDTWIGSLAYNEQAQNTYTEWLKRTQSLTYIFQNEIEKLNDDFNSNFIIQDGQHPNALKLYLRKEPRLVISNRHSYAYTKAQLVYLIIARIVLLEQRIPDSYAQRRHHSYAANARYICRN